MLPAVLIGAACSAELPDCPPGTAFEDCRPSAIANNMATGQVPAMGGSSSVSMGGTGGAPTAGGGGTGSTLPPSGEGGTATVIAPPSMGGSGGNPPSTVDNCPTDPAKTLPGVCGCGTPDDDLDGDDVADCSESCPDNPDRTLPQGDCGCSTITDTAVCGVLRNAIRNLYTFDGEGLTIEDSAGDANGTLLDAVGTTAPADLARAQLNGRLNLEGAGTFVQLPAGFISTLTNATFEAWVTWRGAAPWPRIFDFGNTNGAGAGLSYIFLTPQNSLTNTLRVAYSVAGPGAAETLVDGPIPLPTAGAAGTGLEHVAVVVDDALGLMQLYSNGAPAGSVALAGNLADIADINNWLGRSNFQADPTFFGSMIEFRIYDQALTGPQINTSFQAGPGALN